MVVRGNLKVKLSLSTLFRLTNTKITSQMRRPHPLGKPPRTLRTGRNGGRKRIKFARSTPIWGQSGGKRRISWNLLDIS